MGLSYLEGRSWWEVSREERFFCAQLFHLVQQGGLVRFLSYLNARHDAGLVVDANWELAYEVCFYRDLWQSRGKKRRPFSKKRTFDLCLFSDETIVVIEAKAQQKFDDDQ